MTICKLSDIVSPAFKDSHKAIKSGEIDEDVEKGGRASAKSSFISAELVLQIIQHPDVHATVFRRYQNTLRHTVYAQVCWAITELGLHSKFNCTVSPMECTYKPTGQKIMFFGMDDPGKIKSIKVQFGYIGIGWFEELDQFEGPEQIRNVEQSILRGGPFSLTFKSFNPPATISNWANQYATEARPRQLIHHSTYLTTPEEWLGPRFLADAEHLRTVNPRAYAHEYLGEITGTGGNVFEFLTAREITDEEIEQLCQIYQGCDWGWYPDPYSFVRLNYDPNREEIIFIDEHYVNKQKNAQTGRWIIDQGYCDYEVTCDSAEQKSVGDYRDMGIPAYGAKKGPGSVEYSMKWLAGKRIVIDPRRCPNAWREFSQYEYERDKAGNVISGYPDKDNHAIDATRYALERVWRRRWNHA